MELKIDDYEQIEIFADDIGYIIYKDNLGLIVTRNDGESIKIKESKHNEIIIDGTK